MRNSLEFYLLAIDLFRFLCDSPMMLLLHSSILEIRKSGAFFLRVFKNLFYRTNDSHLISCSFRFSRRLSKVVSLGSQSLFYKKVFIKKVQKCFRKVKISKLKRFSYFTIQSLSIHTHNGPEDSRPKFGGGALELEEL